MQTTKLFQDDEYQAVDLPEEYRFEGDLIYIKQIGNALVLLPYDQDWQKFLDTLEIFLDDFPEKDQRPQEQRQRDKLDNPAE